MKGPIMKEEEKSYARNHEFPEFKQKQVTGKFQLFDHSRLVHNSEVKRNKHEIHSARWITCNRHFDTVIC